MNKLLVAMAIAIFGASSAHAGFMVEPYLGYESGKAKQGSNEFDYAGTLFGARLGYSTMGFMFGADYMTGSGTVDTTPTDTDLKSTDMGVFVGYEFPVLIRAYLSYFFDSKSTFDGSSVDNEGSGTRIGVGFTGLPFVAINLEMINHTYDEYSNGVAISPELTSSTYALTISLPLP